MHPDPQPLTEKQMQAIRFIGRYHALYGKAPSVRQLGAALYVKKVDDVTLPTKTLPVYLIRELRRKGYVSRLSRRARILLLTPTGRRWFEEDAAMEPQTTFVLA